MDVNEIMKSIEKYVRLESNKKATVSTVQKLIKLTKEKKACFLCKQATDEECIEGISQNFKPDVANFDDKIADARAQVQSKVRSVAGKAGSKNGDTQHIIDVAQQIIDESMQELFNQSK